MQNNRYDNDNKYDDRNAGRYETRLGLNNVQRDEKKSFASVHTSAPKKTTWASIASQPAKLTSRVSNNCCFKTFNVSKLKIY